MGVIPREIGINPDPDPEIDGEDGISKNTRKYPLGHSSRYPDDKSPLMLRIYKMEL